MKASGTRRRSSAWAGEAACREVRSRLEEAGASVARGSPSGAIRVLIGPWSRVQGDAAAGQIEEGPQASGVFAEFTRRGGEFELQGLGEDGKPARSLRRGRRAGRGDTAL